MLAPVNLRFAELIQSLGVNKNAFAHSLGKTASVVQHLIDGRNKPGYDLLCKVFEIYPNVSKDWLMEGRGPMLLAGAPEIALPAASAAFASPAVALKKAAGAAPLFAASAAFAAPVAEETPVAAAASAPLPAPAPVAAVAAPAPAADAAIGAALQTQHLLHQLALAELRNQHLLEQQLLLRQLLELAQRR